MERLIKRKKKKSGPVYSTSEMRKKLRKMRTDIVTNKQNVDSKTNDLEVPTSKSLHIGRRVAVHDYDATSTGNSATIGYSDINEENHHQEPEETEDNSTDSLKRSGSKCKYDIPTLSRWTMFEKSNFSIWDVMNMVQALFLRFHLSNEARFAIFSLCILLAGPAFEALNISKYIFEKLLEPPLEFMSYVFFCDKCFVELDDPIPTKSFKSNLKKICKECGGVKTLSLASENYFTIVSMEYQLRAILKDKETRDSIIANSRKNRSPHHSICDVYDGERYVNNELRFKSDDTHIVASFSTNVDGGAMKNNSKKSLWPLQNCLNELPIKLRLRTFILGSLWYTSREPHPKSMNLYLKYFTDAMKTLADKGITIVTETGKKLTFYFFVMAMILDAPARAIVQNIMRCGGYRACNWCYHVGKCINGKIKYPLTAAFANKRSHEQHIVEASRAEKKNQSCVLRARKNTQSCVFRKGKKIQSCCFHRGKINRSCIYRKGKKQVLSTVQGVKGYSEIMSLPCCDIIGIFSAEYMHNCLLGVTKQLWNQWVKKTFKYKPEKLRKITERLCNIKPTKDIHRYPQNIKNTQSWHASDWEYWLLFYSVPVLAGILEEKLLISYTLFVRSIHMLLSEYIAEEMLLECEMMIIQFVWECQKYYGPWFMTYNMHILLHLVDSVRLHGPLWATSAFGFESNMGHFKDNISGTRAIMTQIVSKTFQMKELNIRISDNVLNEKCTTFYNFLFERRKLLSSSVIKTEEGATIYGQKCNNSDVFLKCIYNGKVFYSAMYDRPRKSDDTFVLLENDIFAKIEFFQLIEEKCYVHIRIINVIPAHETNHIYRIASIEDEIVCINVTAIRKKVVNVEMFDVVDGNYICVPPNNNYVL